MGKIRKFQILKLRIVRVKDLLEDRFSMCIMSHSVLVACSASDFKFKLNFFLLFYTPYILACISFEVTLISISYAFAAISVELNRL